MTIRASITGCGSYLPKNKVTNAMLVATLETSHEWIESRTGITQRFIANKEETTSYMAYHAAKKALENASILPKDVDMIIVATTTPDRIFPSVGAYVQAMLENCTAVAFDVQAVCSGFIYALSIAESFIKTGQHKNILVIGAEKMSRILDWSDRTTAILFGDGAGCVLLQATTHPNKGILSSHLHTDGHYSDLLYVEHVTEPKPFPSFLEKDIFQRGAIHQKGSEVFRHAVKCMNEACLEALEHNNITIDDVSWLIPHQANKRILDKVGEKLNIDPKKVIITVNQHANTSAATIPMALDHAKGNFKEGDILLLCALGGGLTWGSCLLRW